MTTPAIMFITAGLLLLTALFMNQTKKHEVEAERIMTSLSNPTKQDDTTTVDEKLSIKEYVKLNPQVSSTELATLYNVSLRTAQRAIKNINLNNN
jgi:predicted HTH transcriptional regulator